MKNFLVASKAMTNDKVKKVVMGAYGQNRFELYKRLLQKSIPPGWKMNFYSMGKGGKITLIKI